MQLAMHVSSNTTFCDSPCRALRHLRLVSCLTTAKQVDDSPEHSWIYFSISANICTHAYCIWMAAVSCSPPESVHGSLMMKSCSWPSPLKPQSCTSRRALLQLAGTRMRSLTQQISSTRASGTRTCSSITRMFLKATKAPASELDTLLSEQWVGFTAIPRPPMKGAVPLPANSGLLGSTLAGLFLAQRD